MNNKHRSFHYVMLYCLSMSALVMEMTLNARKKKIVSGKTSKNSCLSTIRTLAMCQSSEFG